MKFINRFPTPDELHPLVTKPLYETHWWFRGWNFNRPVIARISIGVNVKTGPFTLVRVGEQCPMEGFQAEELPGIEFEIEGPIALPADWASDEPRGGRRQDGGRSAGITSDPAEYSYGYDEERFEGRFLNPEEAALAGFEADEQAQIVFVGRNLYPWPPESYLDAEDILAHIRKQDGYDVEWAGYWPRASTTQITGLTASLRETFGEWLDAHNARPKFSTVDEIKPYSRSDVSPEAS